jgi:hypothetical protein
LGFEKQHDPQITWIPQTRRGLSHAGHSGRLANPASIVSLTLLKPICWTYFLVMLQAFICVTCGTQYPPSEQPPKSCEICQDERQFVDPRGQTWTTLAEVRTSHRAVISRYETGLYGIGATPEFAIGQRALLVCSGSGNVLWDCLALLDDAISHPHFYTTTVEWPRI